MFGEQNKWWIKNFLRPANGFSKAPYLFAESSSEIDQECFQERMDCQYNSTILYRGYDWSEEEAPKIRDYSKLQEKIGTLDIQRLDQIDPAYLPELLELHGKDSVFTCFSKSRQRTRKFGNATLIIKVDDSLLHDSLDDLISSIVSGQINPLFLSEDDGRNVIYLENSIPWKNEGIKKLQDRFSPRPSFGGPFPHDRRVY